MDLRLYIYNFPEKGLWIIITSPIIRFRVGLNVQTN